MNCRVLYTAGRYEGQQAVVAEGTAMAMQKSGEATIIQRTNDAQDTPTRATRTKTPPEKSPVETKDE